LLRVYRPKWVALLTITGAHPILCQVQVRNRAGILLLIGAIVVLLLLAIGINGVQLLSGRPFSLGAAAPPPPGGNDLGPGSGDNVSVQVFRVLLIATMVLLPLTIVMMLLTPSGRRQLLAYVIIFGALVVALLLIRSGERKPADDTTTTGPVVQGTPLPTVAPPATDVFTPTVPDWAVIAASLVVALLLCGLVAAVIWFAWRRSHPPSALQELAQEAQQAIDALQAGGELKDTVLRCYSEMSRVLREERGIQRQAAMTAREFERALRDHGIPDEPVQQLTRLFEQVRYGHEHLGAQAEQQAIASLSAIVAASGAAGRMPADMQRQTP
jgi:hypothetical protein